MARPRTPISAHGAVAVAQVDPGKWRARTRYRFEDGRLRQVERFSTSESKARAALLRALTTIDEYRGEDLNAGSTVAVLADRFIQSKADGQTSTSTFANYSRTIEKLIKPGIGALTIRETTPERLQRFLDRVSKENGPASAKSCRSVLSGMMGLAVRNSAARSNPVRELERIRQKRQGASALTPEALSSLLEKVATDDRLVELDLSDLVRFMAGVGCRVGEAIALSWSDVSSDFTKVTFRATAVRVTGQGLTRQPHGKTDSSARTISVPSQVVEILHARHHSKAQGTLLVFPTVQGNLRDPQNTERDWRLARVRLNLGDVKLHAFRKTVATVLDSAGLSARDIAEYLGHKNPSMTQDVYMSKNVGSDRAAAALSQ